VDLVTTIERGVLDEALWPEDPADAEIIAPKAYKQKISWGGCGGRDWPAFKIILECVLPTPESYNPLFFNNGFPLKKHILGENVLCGGLRYL